MENRKTEFHYPELSEESKKCVLEKLKDINTFEGFGSFNCEVAGMDGINITAFDVDKQTIEGELQKHTNCHDVAESIMRHHDNSFSIFVNVAANYLAAWDNITNGFEDGSIVDEDANFLNAILQDYLTKLTEEYNYLKSEEAIHQTITDCSYTFYENGDLVQFT